MIYANKLEKYLRLFADSLGSTGQIDMLLVGGAAIALKYGGRDTTKDVDAVFSDIFTKQFLARGYYKELVAQFASEYNLEKNWLSDSVMQFVTPEIFETKELLFATENVTISTPSAKALLAMKAMSMRIGPEFKDVSDIELLLDITGIATVDEGLDLINHFYPKEKGRWSRETAIGFPDIIVQRQRSV